MLKCVFFHITVYLQCLQIVLLQFSASGVYANEIEKSESYENKNVPRDDTNGLRLEHNPDSGSDGSIDERINNLYSSSVGSQERLSVLKESYEEDLPESYNTKQYFRVQKEQDTTGQDKAKRNFQVAVIDYQEKKGLNDVHDRNHKTNLHSKTKLSSIDPGHKHPGQKQGIMPGKSLAEGNFKKDPGIKTYEGHKQGSKNFKGHKQQIPDKMQNKFTDYSKKKQVNYKMPSSYKHKEGKKFNIDRTNENKLNKKKHDNDYTDKSNPNPTLKFEEEGANKNSYYHNKLTSAKPSRYKIKNKSVDHGKSYTRNINPNTTLKFEEEGAKENNYHYKKLTSAKPNRSKIKNKSVHYGKPYNKSINHTSDSYYKQHLPIQNLRNVKKIPYEKKATSRLPKSTQKEEVTTKIVRHDTLKHKKHKKHGLDKGHDKNQHNYDRERVNQNQKGKIHKEKHKTPMGHEHNTQVTKYDNEGKVSDKDILRQRPKKHKSSSDLRVTQGYYSNKKVAKADKHRNKHRPPSYESIEMMESDDSDSNKHEKATTRMLQSTKGRPTRPSKQKKAALKVEKDVFKPYSIAAQLECLRKKLSDFAIIEQEVVSKTVEYNDIVLWKIKEKPDDMDSATASFRASKKKVIPYDPPEKKIILIVHGLTVMGWHNLDCLNKIKRFETLVGYYMENLDCYDIFLIPMANPDGVTKSLNTQPWNKNMSPQNACPGVNLDRNFDVEWNSNASKESSCKQSYPGPEPFSERETKVVRDLLKTYSQRMVAYIHVHAGSYDSTVFKGDAVLYPRGYSDDTSDDDKYIDLKGDIDEAMRNTSLNVVSVAVETLYNWYGMTTGSSVDYASKVYGIPYAMELVMQLYEDDDQEVDEDKREQNAALVEIWQVVIDVIFDSIYKREIKPEEQ